MPQPRLVGALLCRNEGAPDRYLRLALENALKYCQTVVVVDDSSTDNTLGVLAEYPQVQIVALGGAQRETEASGGFWGSDEVTPRAALWDTAMRAAGPGNWVYIFDADHELVGISPNDLALCLHSEHVTAWALLLWDCWNSGTQMRVDGYWQAHKHPRPWFFRNIPEFVPNWSGIARKGVHVGHYPPNYPLVTGCLPGAAIRHWSYVNPDHRQAKAAKYLALA